jgi:hypothetical protein
MSQIVFIHHGNIAMFSKNSIKLYGFEYAQCDARQSLILSMLTIMFNSIIRCSFLFSSNILNGSFVDVFKKAR